MILFLRNLVLHDFWLKLFSLALAVLIWEVVSYREIPAQSLAVTVEPTQTFYHVPVLVTSAAADVRNVHVRPDNVDVEVRGDARRLQAIQPDRDIRALVDLSGIVAASGLRKDIAVTTPPGVTLVQVNPAEVDVIVPPRH